MPTKESPKKRKKNTFQNSRRVKSIKKQIAGSGNNICSKDINQLLMGNPPDSIGGKEDIDEIWKDTKKSAKEFASYGGKGWGNYPGLPPQPDCVIL